jgi:MFS family permease
MLAINWLRVAWVPEFVLHHLPGAFKYRFVVGYMIMNAGFMTGRPIIFALYSKLIGSEYQGKYLGWMVAGSSAARTLGPFIAVTLYYHITATGVKLLVLFGLVGLFHVGCLVLVFLLWPQLLPSMSLLQSHAASERTSPLREELMVHEGELA